MLQCRALQLPSNQYNLYDKRVKAAIAILPQVIGPDPTIARRYMKALSLAFCQTYVMGILQYRTYLSASYAQAISQAPINLSFVQFLRANQLTQALGDSIPSSTRAPKR